MTKFVGLNSVQFPLADLSSPTLTTSKFDETKMTPAIQMNDSKGTKFDQIDLINGKFQTSARSCLL